MIENKAQFVALAGAEGYRLLTVSDFTVVDIQPVIGFLIYKHPLHDKSCFYHSVHPVTSEEVHDFNCQKYALIRPDGQIEVPADRVLSGFNDFVHYLQESKKEPD